jgi:hypothetical protein
MHRTGSKVTINFLWLIDNGEIFLTLTVNQVALNIRMDAEEVRFLVSPQ